MPEKRYPFNMNFIASDALQYKLVSDSEQQGKYYVVPRLAYIKDLLKQISRNNPALKKENCLIEGFTGIVPEEWDLMKNSCTAELEQEQANYQMLVDLDVFNTLTSDEIPTIRNGCVADNEIIKHVLIIRHSDKHDLIGAIYFIVDLETEAVEIEALATTSAERSKGFGSVLLQSALILCILYGAKNVTLMSTQAGVPLYVKHDFYLTYCLDDNSWKTVTNLKEIEDYFIKNGMQDLQLDIPFSLNKLNGFIAKSIPDFNEFYFIVARQWIASGELLSSISGKTLAIELERLKNHIKMPETVEKNLKNKVGCLSFKRKWKTLSAEDLPNKKNKFNNSNESFYDLSKSLKFYGHFFQNEDNSANELAASHLNQLA